MTDAAPPLNRPPDRLDRIANFIGQIARPLAIIMTSFSASGATLIIAGKIKDGNDGAIFIAGVFAGVGALYIGKAVEVFKTNRAAADVEIARSSTAEGTNAVRP